MNESHQFDPSRFAELFDFSDEVDEFITDSLTIFNTRRIKLFDLPAYQRIFLFILTRSIKTYSSINILCRSGYGQDVATLMRSLLENLITANYIVHEESSANTLAKRFVAYKWVIFKRQLPEQEIAVRQGTEDEKNAFIERKNLVLAKVDNFKSEFGIISDRALITWSGKSARDMARKVSRALLDEYEKTFRLCSRFSHPSILGDNEYLIQNENQLTFSPEPSTIGIQANLVSATQYALDFVRLSNKLFKLELNTELERLSTKLKSYSIDTSSDETSTTSATSPSPIRDSIVTFQRRKKQ